jgi:hypothetical protein
VVKKKIKEPLKKQKELPRHPKEEPGEQENRFEFGGLPQRNLKKNLGCG